MRNGTYAIGAEPLKAVSLKEEVGDVCLVAEVKRLNYPLARVVWKGLNFRILFWSLRLSRSHQTLLASGHTELISRVCISHSDRGLVALF
jgi:hypothetical protein